MTDVRANKPSASGLERIAACPASWSLEQKAKELAGYSDDGNEASQRGTRIHAWLAGEKIELAPEELECAEACLAIEQRLVDAWKVEGNDIAIHREQRLWYAELFSGQADVIYLQGNRALILDYKTGRTASADSSLNWQLAGLVLLASEAFPQITEFRAAIIQPAVTWTPQIVEYTGDDMPSVMHGILDILAAANSNNPQPNAGDHCNYCKGKLICPAQKQDLETMSLATINAPGLLISNQELSGLLDKCGRAMRLIGEIKAEAKRRIDAGEVVEGWEVVIPEGRRKVSDVTTVAERLVANGSTWESVAAASTITIGSVKTLARTATNKKGKDLDTLVAGILEGATDISEAKPQLKRIGSNDEE